MDSYFPITNPSFKTQEMAQHLQHTANELNTKLRTEKQRLQPYGVSLPINTLRNLDEIHGEFDKLNKRIQDMQFELLQLRNLAKTTAMINSSLELEEVLLTVMDRMVQLVGAERGTIVLRDEETGELEVKVARKIGTFPGQRDELLFSKTVVRKVMESNQPLLSTNAQEDPDLQNENPDNSIAGYNLRSILCVPLTFRDEVVGAVYCDNSMRDGLFGKRELRMLSAFANQAAIAIENARLFEQIKSTLQEIIEIKSLLDNILASIASGVVTLDRQQTITIYNPAAEVIFGRNAAQTVGHSLDAVLPPLYYFMRRNMFQRVGLRDEVIAEEAEIEFDGRGPLSLNLQLTTLKTASNETQGLALVADDLTEVKRRDATLAAVRRYLPPVMVDNIQQINQIALGGERRRITIMYVDVRPFDTFSSDLSPKGLMETLNTYLTIASEGIHHHAGLIDKYMGSEIMALFNTQLNPAEDEHAWQAVQAALRIATDLATLAKYMQHGDTNEVFFRIGINTGIATIGNVGSSARREFSAIGDSVNFAKRLQENARRGQILLSQKTVDACAAQLEEAEWIGLSDVGELEVKGKSELTTVYECYEVRD
ncbi:MAG: GAF domain-containing protein [Chloroflexi bacterium]|nr:GAF domain-containing protein [Chloroflexota bacterium]